MTARMTDFNDIGLGPEGEGETSGAGPGPAPFDPLFSPWDEDTSGSTFGPPPSLLARRQDPDGFLTWDLPAPALAGELSYPAPALTWRPAPALEPQERK